MSSAIRIGVVGCGRILNAHLRGFRILQENRIRGSLPDYGTLRQENRGCPPVSNAGPRDGTQTGAGRRAG